MRSDSPPNIAYSLLLVLVGSLFTSVAYSDAAKQGLTSGESVDTESAATENRAAQSAAEIGAEAENGISGFAVLWSTVDGGSGDSAGGVFAAQGTFGQTDTQVLDGGDFKVIGGFWAPLPLPESASIFADGFESGGTSAWSSSEN